MRWTLGDGDFTAGRYSRGHTWSFDGGVEVPASASPQVVPLPDSVAEAVDPEEAFVAALSSCHMLFFLSLAAEKGVVVESYRDEAEGRMRKGDDGRIRITDVTLRPEARYRSGTAPDPALIEALHHEAHERCFIANSVTAGIETVIVS
ncbi:MAG: OsmC family protein [Woeseiaceae bacterium]|nr:OsmC family protein [Woeseiaceae bacterium]